jgi:predicted transcriptional regulator
MFAIMTNIFRIRMTNQMTKTIIMKSCVLAYYWWKHHKDMEDETPN